MCGKILLELSQMTFRPTNLLAYAGCILGVNKMIDPVCLGADFETESRVTLSDSKYDDTKNTKGKLMQYN